MQRSILNANLLANGRGDFEVTKRDMPETRRTAASLFGQFATILIVFMRFSAAAQAHASEKFGGVEIGAKGVKASGVEIDRDGATPRLKVLDLNKKSIDVTIARLKGKKFNATLIDDTAEVVKGFVAVLQSELGIPEANIRVVASSGVPFTNNFTDLVTAIRGLTNKDVEKIDAKEEATLTTLALVPKDLRTITLVMDIGSGNTKGGVFLDDSGSPEQFVTMEVPFGTTTLTAEIDKKAASVPTPRYDMAREVGKELVGDSIRRQLADRSELGQRELVLFAGGSVWAFVTIMKPETALEPFAKVTAADIKAYGELLNRTPGTYPEVDFSKVDNADARKIAEADYSRIRGATGDTPIFKPEELLTGAVLLEQIADSLTFSTRTVLFDRKAVTAWITAYITPNDLRYLLPQALKRKLTYVRPLRGPEPAPTLTSPPEPPVSVGRRIDETIALKAYSEGCELYWSGQHSEALAAFQKAIKFSEGDARFLYFKGLAEMALGDTTSAESSITQASRLENRNMPDSRTIGMALVRIQGPVRRYIEKIGDRVREAEVPNKSR